MEEYIEIPTEDNHIIYGTLNYSSRKTSLIIFVHGLTGSQQEHHYYNAPAFFNDSFETFRFDFYPNRPKGRMLSECSISLHAKDLQLVIGHLKGKYKKIFLVGHSLGCPVILRANLKEISKIVLWDPTKGIKKIEDKNCAFIPSLDKYLLNWGKEMLVSQKMIDEWKESSNLESEIKKITVPCKFIFAGRHDILPAWLPIVKKSGLPYTVIENATHVFVEEGAEKKLFELTKEFLLRQPRKEQ
jgi:pimeloyl-ACP methyl ester carboxylesterase